MNYQELLNASTKLNEQIKLRLNPEGNSEQLSMLPPNIDGLEIDKSMLIFGINPSSNDLDSGEKRQSVLGYVNLDNPIVKQFYKKGFTYPVYFKKNYELAPENFSMLWEAKGFLENNFKDFKENELEFLLKNRNSTGNYVTFTELAYYKETSAKKVQPVLEKLKNEVLDLFNMQLAYYNPNIVVITNAFASRFVNKNLSDGSRQTEINYMGIPILFSGMATGQGAMDVYSYYRLQRDVSKFL